MDEGRKADLMGRLYGHRQAGIYDDSTESHTPDTSASEALGDTPTVHTSSSSSARGAIAHALHTPAPPGGTAAIHSQPAYAPAQQAPSARELALRASAADVRTAMAQEKPLKALQKIFKRQAEVRLELPALFSLRDTVIKQAPDSYGKFCEMKWLRELNIRYLELRFQTGVRDDGKRFSDNIAFMHSALGHLNKLANNNNALSVSVSVDVPNPSDAGSALKMLLEMALMNFFRLLQADQVVVRLSLSGMQSAHFKSTTLSEYFYSLGKNAKLAELDLSGAALSDIDASALANGLKQNRSIALIDLRNCLFQDAGRLAIKSVLDQRPDIKVLS